MMYIVIVIGTLLGGGAAASIQSLVSNAAKANEQGQTAGSVASLNSLMAAFAPVVGATLLGLVSHRPQGDVWIGLPFYFCALLQALGTVVAIFHFRRAEAAPVAAAA